MGQIASYSSEIDRDSEKVMESEKRTLAQSGKPLKNIKIVDDEDGEFPLTNVDTKKANVEHRVTFGTSVHVQDFRSDYWSDIEDENTNFITMGKIKAYVIIDVGGERFQANRDSFLKYPNTRLGRLMKSSSIQEILSLCEEYIPGNPPEYFFDKNPENFPSVLQMYRTGDFHIPDGGRG